MQVPGYLNLLFILQSGLKLKSRSMKMCEVVTCSKFKKVFLGTSVLNISKLKND